MPPQEKKKSSIKIYCGKNKERRDDCRTNSYWLVIIRRQTPLIWVAYHWETKDNWFLHTHCLSTANILRESAWRSSWKEIATTNTSTANYTLKALATSLPALSSTGAVGLEYKVDGMEGKWSCSLTEVVRVEVGPEGWGGGEGICILSPEWDVWYADTKRIFGFGEENGIRFGFQSGRKSFVHSVSIIVNPSGFKHCISKNLLPSLIQWFSEWSVGYNFASNMKPKLWSVFFFTAPPLWWKNLITV